MSLPPPPLLLADAEDSALRRLRDRLGERVEVLLAEPREFPVLVHRVAGALGSGRPLRVYRCPAASPDRRSLLERLLAEARALHGGTVGTLLAREEEWMENILASAPRLVTLPSVEAWRGSLAGRAVLVAGAGPSLDHLAPFLPVLASRCTVIAAASALAPLARLGIDPAVVVVVEGRNRRSQLNGARHPGRTALVVAQHGHPSHLDPRFRALLRLDAAENGWFANLAPPPAAPFPTGGNVGTTALRLALHWGADPVILAGLDFAWPAGGASHAPGTASPPAGPEHGDFLEAPGTGGGTVRTTALLASYRANTEATLREFPGREVINPVRPGAARIAGTREEDPARLLPRLPALAPPAPEPPPAPPPPDRRRLHAALGELAADLDRVAAEARRLLAAGAGPAEFRARLGTLLARRPASLPAAILRGPLLAPGGDPRVAVSHRLRRGLDWLRRLAERLA